MEYMPPEEILDLFVDEETASAVGRQAFLDWYFKIKPEPGDRMFVPEVGGGRWWKQGYKTH